MNTHNFAPGWGYGDHSYLASSTPRLVMQQSTVGQPYTVEERAQSRISWAEKGYTSQVPTQSSDLTVPMSSCSQPASFIQHVPTLPASTGTGTVSPTAVFGGSVPTEVSFPSTTYSTPDISRGVTPDKPKHADELLCRIILDSGVWSEPRTDKETSRGIPSPESPSAPITITHPTVTSRRSNHGKPLKRTRIAQACEPCRKRKHKCSGSVGGNKCARCQLKKLSCVFAPTVAQLDGAQAGVKVKKPKLSIQTELEPGMDYVEESTAQPYPTAHNQLQLSLDGANTSTPQYQAPSIQSHSSFRSDSSFSSSSTHSFHFDHTVTSYPPINADLSSFNVLGVSNAASMYPYDVGPSTSSYPPLAMDYSYNTAGSISSSMQHNVTPITLPQYGYAPEYRQETSLFQDGYSGYYHNTSANFDRTFIESPSDGSFISTPFQSETILSPWDHSSNGSVDTSCFPNHVERF